MRTVDAELVGERPDLRLGWDVKPVGVGRFPRYSWRWPTVTALDGRLADQQSRDVECRESTSLLAAATDLSTVVIADEEALHLLSPAGADMVPIPRADSVTLMAGGRALVTGRLEDHRHRAYLVAMNGGDIIDEVDLEAYEAEINSLPHPHDGSVLLDAGEGQDGSRGYLARVSGDRLYVDEVFTDVVVADFSPSGRHLLLVPHPSSANVVSLLEWPERRSIAVLDSADLDFNTSFDFYGCFIRNDTVVMKTVGEGLLVAGNALSDVARIRLSGLDVEVNGDIAIDAMIGLGDDTIGVDVWRDGHEHATIWRIPTT
jgi:hypothetical protein